MKILYVTTISNTMGFFTEHINKLLDAGHTVDMACNVLKPINTELIERGCNVYNLEFQRSPIKADNISAYKKLKKLIKENEYDLVHTHTPIASFFVRLACKGLKEVRVLYTAHGFHFFKGAPLKNWLLYYPIEYWLSKYTDLIITINKEDYRRAKKSFMAKSIKYIPGVGLDTKKIRQTVIDKTDKRKELGLEENSFVILSVGELNRNKNHETIIRSIEKLNNSNIHYIICGQGPMKDYLRELSSKLGLSKQVTLLGYRKDVIEICKCADVFAFPSKREGLGMAALEAMASGLPIVTSNVHGIVDYSIDGETGFCLNPEDVHGFAAAIEKLVNDEVLRNEMGQNNIELVEKFSTEVTITKLLEIYQVIQKNI